MTAGMRGGTLIVAVVLLVGCDCGPRPGFSRGELRLSPASLSLSAAPGAVASQAVLLSNTGTADVAVASVSVEGDPSFSATPASLTVSAGASAQVTVSYAPSDAGDHAGRLVLEAEASNGSTFIVALLGTSRRSVGDAGPTDAGPADAGPGDAGMTDAGPPDSGVPDAGPPDAGPLNVLGFTSGLGPRFSAGGTWSVEGVVGLPAPRVVCTGGTFSVEPLIPQGGN